MAVSYKTVGFIGLGAMGFPMVENLDKKLPSSVKIYVFDVSADAIQRITAKNPARVLSCTSSKEVAENSVS